MTNNSAAVTAYNADTATSSWLGDAVRDRQPPAAKFAFSDESVKGLDSAFRTCFQEMLAKPLDKGTLTAIEQLATHARSALSIVSTKSDVEQAEEAVRARASTLLQPTVFGSSYALAPAPRSETFGATVIRELMAMAKTMHRDPTKMVQAAATARAEGMTELADQLEAEIAAQFTSAKEKPAVDERPKVVKLNDRRKKKVAR